MKAFKVIIVAVVILFFVAAGYVVWQNPAGDFRVQPRQPATAQGAPLVQQAAPVQQASPDHTEPQFYDVDIPEGYKLAGVSLGATADEVVSILGQPLKKERHSEQDYPYDGQYTLWVEIWFFDGVKVTFSESVLSTDPKPAGPGTVDCVAVTGGSHQTQDGVRVGDSFERLRQCNPKPAEDDTIVARNLQFKLLDGRVVQIELAVLSME